MIAVPSALDAFARYFRLRRAIPCAAVLIAACGARDGFEGAGADENVGVVTEALTDTITIKTLADLNNKRSALLNKVWGVSTLNTTDDISAPPTALGDIQNLPNLQKVERYRVDMATAGGGVISVIAEHYIPQTSPARPRNNKLVILNPGHTSHYEWGTHGEADAVAELLNDGFGVLATYMPTLTPTDQSDRHEQLFHTASLRPAGGKNPIFYYLDPIRRSLNHVENGGFGYTNVYMAGLSGGGWTTTLYAALDTRIEISIPVAGSEPFDMRPVQTEHGLTAEQEYDASFNDFYATASYEDLYVMGGYGSGRRQIQVLNRNDDCCFGLPQYTGSRGDWTTALRGYETDVRNRVAAIGAGAFRLEINDADDCVLSNTCTAPSNPAKHELSKNTRIAIMLDELNGASPFLASDGSSPLGRGGNGHLYKSNGSTSWTDTGLPIVGTPAIVTGAISGHVYDIFYRTPDNVPEHAYFTGTSWLRTSDISGRTISDLAAISWGAGRIDVFGYGTDYILYHAKYANGAWSPWDALTDSSWLGVGQIALTSSGPDHLDVFFRGFSNRLNHLWSTNDQPFSREWTNGIMKNYASVVSNGNTLLVYALGTDDHLWEKRQTNGGAWSGYDLSASTPNAGSIRMVGSPSAVRNGTSIAVYGRISGYRGDKVGIFSGSGCAPICTSWTFTDALGAPNLGAPTAISSGAYIIDPTAQTAFEVSAPAGTPHWQALGGYLDR